jgi:hypothetical protein
MLLRGDRLRPVLRLLPLLLAACGPRGVAPTTGDTGPAPGPPVAFDVLGFNVESGGSDAQVVADEIVSVIQGEALLGFAEVESEATAELLVAAAADEGQVLRFVLGTTGYSDRLVLAWDDAVFSLDASEELDDINVGGTVRAPLVGEMTHRESGLAFLFVVNHLWRTDDGARHEQAELLNAWGREQTAPVVMVGDYNLDWEIDTGDHDRGYDELTADGVFEWVQPATLLKTQCSSFYESVLDFVFVGGAARDWTASSEILRPSNEYCSPVYEETFSDHRPVRASFTIP